MCLVLFAFDPHGDRPLVVAANRDEFYARPAESAHYWEDAPGLLAGRDLSAGGTWLGVSRRGRFATVTNFAEEGPVDAPRSRGHLPEAFLAGTDDAHHFAHHLHGRDYRGFNLLLFDGAQLVYTSNFGHTQTLTAGIYGLANAELGATWPKVTRGRAALTAALAGAPASGDGPRLTTDTLLDILADRSAPPDGELPRRGRPLELERRVAPCFIAGDEYGTRASTVLIVERDRVHFTEQEYGPGGVPGKRTDVDFHIE